MRGDIRRLNSSSFFFAAPFVFLVPVFLCCKSLGGERPVPRGSQTTAGLHPPGTNGYTSF